MNQPVNSDFSRLLTDNDISPVDCINESGRFPLLLTCEHAGQNIPARLGNLGLYRGEINRHIAYDLGAEAVARQLSLQLDAPLVVQRYSRLVVDCNRPLNAGDCIPITSDGTTIPGNQDLEAFSRQQRYNEIHQPFHAEVARQLDRRGAAEHKPVLISVHSFTPQLKINGEYRPWQLGLLYNRDDRIAKALQSVLTLHEPQLNVALNQPYQITDEGDYTIPVHGEQRGIRHVLLEIKNSEIEDRNGQSRWVKLLAKAVSAVINEDVNSL